MSIILSALLIIDMPLCSRKIDSFSQLKDIWILLASPSPSRVIPIGTVELEEKKENRLKDQAFLIRIEENSYKEN